jgi:uncharacterized protein YbjT (DUF2867 family)
MANAGKTILVMGATGQQGGAVLKHLQLRAMTRKPEGDKAKALRQAGVDVIAGDFEDEASLEKALSGAWGVFAVQNTWEAGVDALVSTLPEQTRLQMIAVDDIGKYGALVFERAADYNRRELDLAGDAVTLPDAAARLSEALGRKLTYTKIPIAEVRKNSEDFALMLEWFERVGYNADIEGVARETGIKPRRFADWAREIKK